MKQNFLRWMVSMCFGLLSVTMVVAGDHYKNVQGYSISDAADQDFYLSGAGF